jgi:hypothetical protein
MRRFGASMPFTRETAVTSGSRESNANQMFDNNYDKIAAEEQFKDIPKANENVQRGSEIAGEDEETKNLLTPENSEKKRDLS